MSASLEGLLPFVTYFSTGLLAMTLFKFLYARLTPFDEWRLVKQDLNTAAAISIGGALLGYTLALAAAAGNSVAYLDFLIWALIAMAAQLLAFLVVRFVLIPTIIDKIENNQIAGAVVLASINVSVGLLNAACMSY
jgi:putative membrane protein